MHVFEGQTANEVWQKAVQVFRENNFAKRQLGRGGPTNELIHAVCVIQDSRQRWVVSRSPGLSPAFAIVEMLWILNGRKDSAFINPWNPIYQKFAGKGDEYHGAYGFRLR